MKRAVVLAGGLGTRLRPYTAVLPKPLVPLGQYPILDVIIRQLGAEGFEHITLAVNHQADLFRAFFGDGSKWNVLIDYSLETKPLSTMGPLRLVPDLPSNFLVMNGDILSDVRYGAFLDRHVANDRLFTIAASARQQKIDYGVLRVNECGVLSGFEEKPTVPFLVSMGVYAVSRRVLDAIPLDTAFGFDQLVLGYLAAGQPVQTEVHDGYWLDIGRPDDYEKANNDWPEFSKRIGIE